MKDLEGAEGQGGAHPQAVGSCSAPSLPCVQEIIPALGTAKAQPCAAAVPLLFPLVFIWNYGSISQRMFFLSLKNPNLGQSCPEYVGSEGKGIFQAVNIGGIIPKVGL